jgi:hypothetical protein
MSRGHNETAADYVEAARCSDGLLGYQPEALRVSKSIAITIHSFHDAR